MARNITFRTHLIGSVTEFCQKSKIGILSNALNLVDLIVRLARYQEEGARLFPSVYITDSIEKIIEMLPNAERLKIGNAAKDSEGLKQALKKCAPMANGGWLVYVHEGNEQLEFGIFKGDSNPTALMVDDVIMTPSDDMSIVKVFQIADDCVEVMANNDELHYVYLNHRREEDPPPLQHFENLVNQITSEVSENKESVASLLRRVLNESLIKSHGCIIAVTNMGRAPKVLSKDGVILDQPIDFEELIRDFKRGIIPQSLVDSKSEVLSGMLNSDGIVLFDDQARLLGYNIFISVNQSNSIIGGARRRAFETLKKIKERGLVAVFMQSHDGWSEFSGSEL